MYPTNFEVESNAQIHPNSSSSFEEETWQRRPHCSFIIKHAVERAKKNSHTGAQPLEFQHENGNNSTHRLTLNATHNFFDVSGGRRAPPHTVIPYIFTPPRVNQDQLRTLNTQETFACPLSIN